MSTSSLDRFKVIDGALNLYYNSLGRDYATGHDQCGNRHRTFLDLVVEEERNDPTLSIEQELRSQYDPAHCAYTWLYGDTFPIPSYADIPRSGRERFIFYVLQHCYSFGAPPTRQVIADLVSLCGGSIRIDVLNVARKQLGKCVSVRPLLPKPTLINTNDEQLKDLQLRDPFTDIVDMRRYVDATASMQLNDNMVMLFTFAMDSPGASMPNQLELSFVCSDLLSAKGESMYGVVVCQCDNQAKLVGHLTARDIMARYSVQPPYLPMSSRAKLTESLLSKPQANLMRSIAFQTDWRSVQHAQRGPRSKVVATLSAAEWSEACYDTKMRFLADELQLIESEDQLVSPQRIDELELGLSKNCTAIQRLQQKLGKLRELKVRNASLRRQQRPQQQRKKQQLMQDQMDEKRFSPQAPQPKSSDTLLYEAPISAKSSIYIDRSLTKFKEETEQEDADSSSASTSSFCTWMRVEACWGERVNDEPVYREMLHYRENFEAQSDQQQSDGTPQPSELTVLQQKNQQLQQSQIDEKRFSQLHVGGSQQAPQPQSSGTNEAQPIYTHL